jgi:hypothetical protein
MAKSNNQRVNFLYIFLDININSRSLYKKSWNELSRNILNSLEVEGNHNYITAWPGKGVNNRVHGTWWEGWLWLSPRIPANFRLWQYHQSRSTQINPFRWLVGVIHKPFTSFHSKSFNAISCWCLPCIHEICWPFYLKIPQREEGFPPGFRA